MSKLDIPDKIHKKCGTSFWYFTNSNNKYRCIFCHTNSYKKHKDANKKKVKDRNKLYHSLCMSSDKKKEHIHNREKNKRIILSDRYVKHLICSNKGLSFKDIPQDLVELKREQLRLFRDIHSASETTEIRSV